MILNKGLLTELEKKLKKIPSMDIKLWGAQWLSA